jgi:O-antigen ligase
MTPKFADKRMPSQKSSERPLPLGQGLLCWVVAAMIIGQFLAFGANDSFLAVVAAVVEIVVALLAVALTLREDLDRCWRQLAPAMGLFAAAMAWGAAPLVLAAVKLPHGGLLAPAAAKVELVKLAGAGAVLLTGVLVAQSRRRMEALMLALVALGFAYTLLTLGLSQATPYAVFGQPKGPHTFRFTGTLLNANAAGCMFGMLALVSLGVMQHLFKRTDLRNSGLRDYLKLAIAGSGALAAFGATVLTESRTSLLLSLALGAVVIGAEMWRRGQSGKTLGLAGGLILLVGLGLGATQIVSRWSTTAADFSQKIDAYEHYLSAIEATPLFGYGLGGFKAFHESTLSGRLAPIMWDFGAAHSAVTQAALEGGLPFLVLLLAALGAVVHGLIRRPSNRELGAISTAGLAAVVLAVICSFVDIALNVPGVASFALLLLGSAWGAAHARRSRGLAQAPQKAGAPVKVTKFAEQLHV